MGIGRLIELKEERFKKLSDTFTRPDNTTAYLAGDVVADSASSPTLLDFGNLYSRGVKIINAQLLIYLSAAIAGMDTWTLHLYSSAITAKNDNAAWDCVAGDRSSYLGSFDFAACTDSGSTLISQNSAVNLVVDCPNRKLYGILETNGAFTPSAEIEFLINLYVEGC